MAEIGFVYTPALDAADYYAERNSLVPLIDRSPFGEAFIRSAKPDFDAHIAAAGQLLAQSVNLRVTVSAPMDGVNPQQVAQQIAELDHSSGGRISLHLDTKAVAGLGETSHAEIFKRAEEFIVLVRRLWANDKPVTHEGNYYRLNRVIISQKGRQGAAVPIWASGASGSAARFAGRHADVVWLEPGSDSELTVQIQRITQARKDVGKFEPARFVLPVNLSANGAAGATQLLPQDYVAASRLAQHLAQLGVSDLALQGADYGEAVETALRLSPLIHRLKENAAPRGQTFQIPYYYRSRL